MPRAEARLRHVTLQAIYIVIMPTFTFPAAKRKTGLLGLCQEYCMSIITIFAIFLCIHFLLYGLCISFILCLSSFLTSLLFLITQEELSKEITQITEEKIDLERHNLSLEAKIRQKNLEIHQLKSNIQVLENALTNLINSQKKDRERLDGRIRELKGATAQLDEIKQYAKKLEKDLAENEAVYRSLESAREEDLKARVGAVLKGVLF